MDPDAGVKLYSLNPVRVEYYRKVLRCQPYIDYPKARQLIASLSQLADQLDSQMERFNKTCEELVSMGVGAAPYNKRWGPIRSIQTVDVLHARASVML